MGRWNAPSDLDYYDAMGTFGFAPAKVTVVCVDCQADFQTHADDDSTQYVCPVCLHEREERVKARMDAETLRRELEARR